MRKKCFVVICNKIKLFLTTSNSQNLGYISKSRLQVNKFGTNLRTLKVLYCVFGYLFTSYSYWLTSYLLIVNWLLV